MIILDDLTQFKEVYRDGRKWNRCIEAIENLEKLKDGVMYSIGDSLVYMIQDGVAENTSDFIANRRYFDVHYYLEGGESVETADKDALDIKHAYQDETDREFLRGQGQSQKLSQGQVAVFDNNKAYRFHGDSRVRKVVLKVTVEDGYFLNK
ncbi:beta-galactosidase subunit beta [Psychromonas ossibalaenae]|uniref:beta-galactosidase subunit beta n=1 Tax=Psychromonas ossibalaenae TaxID=444922 RepID=UPI000380927E|nr:beta-galactosidase subunit beta [Psychromonas ossibalaenae]